MTKEKSTQEHQMYIKQSVKSQTDQNTVLCNQKLPCMLAEGNSSLYLARS